MTTDDADAGSGSGDRGEESGDGDGEPAGQPRDPETGQFVSAGDRGEESAAAEPGRTTAPSRLAAGERHGQGQQDPRRYLGPAVQRGPQTQFPGGHQPWPVPVDRRVDVPGWYGHQPRADRQTAAVADQGRAGRDRQGRQSSGHRWGRSWHGADRQAVQYQSQPAGVQGRPRATGEQWPGDGEVTAGPQSRVLRRDDGGQ